MLCRDSDIVPLRFHRSSGFADAAFRLAPTKQVHRALQLGRFRFRILLAEEWREATIRVDRFPHEVEAMSILGDLDGECEREGRFIRMHAAYEAVVPNREVRWSAIRHALVHPVHRLTRPDVQKALADAFGTDPIDLGLHAHQKIYYTALVGMLKQIDESLYDTFTGRIGEVTVAAGA